MGRLVCAAQRHILDICFIATKNCYVITVSMGFPVYYRGGCDHFSGPCIGIGAAEFD